MGTNTGSKCRKPRALVAKQPAHANKAHFWPHAGVREPAPASQGLRPLSPAVLGPSGVTLLVLAPPCRSHGFCGAGRPARATELRTAALCNEVTKVIARHLNTSGRQRLLLSRSQSRLLPLPCLPTSTPVERPVSACLH